ncbi:thiamin pyrophosphokinase 2 isoform X2 [Esox lucius]|uniref:thiamin pyrophosphokinase 2 isoform X2 n=1 Tax=Esox lucius TaxID=8010 RepID=UPI000576684A|nr:thiamin pyrophosphokinase 2 isoform X2 [Esox lucius]
MTTWSDKILQLLRRMNNFYLPDSSRTTCFRFELGGEQVGWVPSNVASILSKFPEIFSPPRCGAITLRESFDSYEKRSEAVDDVLQSIRREGCLTVLKGWRDEKYDVMPRFCDTPLMCMERSATSLFGVKRYGVHINGYCRDENGELRMWLGRRSKTKQTYPGKLDNLAAGGLAAGISVKDTLIKECEEEACIPADIAETAHPVSTVSYTYEDKEGVFPESQFVFDLELPREFKPRIGDGEVQDFYLYSMDEVKEVLVSDDFKPNCAMVVLDFLIRHSYIQPDTGVCLKESALWPQH